MTVHHELDCLAEVVAILASLPSGRRGGAVWQALSFEPDMDAQLANAVPVLRAALASVWEKIAGCPVPIKWLRAKFASPCDAPLSALLGRLNVTSSAEQGIILLQLINDLAICFSKRNGTIQPSLFERCDNHIDATPGRCKWQEARTVRSLKELVQAGEKFATIYADPPWCYDNEASRGAAADHYSTMTVDEICAEPVAQLADDSAHLHLWTTNAFLNEAFDVLDAWGFKYKSCLVWVKDNLGMGNYWRVSHEYLLLGVRGQLTFRDRTKRSWVLAPRTEHSHKPAAIRGLIEEVSPGPYLEMYGREELPGSDWTVYGNQIERRLF